MYGMMRYFMGFTDASFVPIEVYGGKLFRSSLCLCIADCYGEQHAAMPAAVSIELFHNFSLIHDDIVDNDPLRRGRATVWKVWGVPHALNAGDGQLILAYKALGECLKKEKGTLVHAFLTERFLEVVEGQYIDFRLTEYALSDSRVTMDAYLTMVRKKTSVLVGAAAYAGGVLSGAEGEAESLYDYGVALGMALQLHDDYVSLWGDSLITGKKPHGDIYEKKKSFPIIFSRDTLSGSLKERLYELYDAERELAEEEVRDVVSLCEGAGAQQATKQRVKEYLAKAEGACSTLPPDLREKLGQLASVLLVEYTSH